MSQISTPTLELLQASMMPGIGSVSLRRLIEAQLANPHYVSGQGGIALPNMEISSPAMAQADAVIHSSGLEDLHIISPFDTTYPRALLRIRDFPPVLYVKGNLASLEKPSCAVVGTREASRLGLSWSRQIASILAEHGYSIVSGLALGIDTSAHEGALQSKGVTVAVLAHGLDKVTPASNKGLATAILEAGGALVAEHPPGTPPRRPEYVRRNRIQSGMSVCSIVVESGYEGGAIHQGNFTFSQGRRLFCVTPDRSVEGADDFKYDGANRLIETNRAERISSRQDVLRLLERRELEDDYKRLVGDDVAEGRFP